MNDVRRKYVQPAVEQTAFNCPHCGALAKQTWFTASANEIGNDSKTPGLWTRQDAKDRTFDHIEDPKLRAETIALIERLAAGQPFLEGEQKYHAYWLANVHVSRCFNCDGVAIWVHDNMVWPASVEAPIPNPDLPADVRLDFEEAGRILTLSPRGAAALLRLALQKLCVHLGQLGKKIDDDIAALVKAGLDKRVQQALDIVRVIGNNAVHPGKIDLRDDRATAEKLFTLINLITEKMISEPKHVDEMFQGLPEGARKAISKRDS
jgi:hypothetical protein